MHGMKLQTHAPRRAWDINFQRNFFLTTSGNFNTQALLMHLRSSPAALWPTKPRLEGRKLIMETK